MRETYDDALLNVNVEVKSECPGAGMDWLFNKEYL